MQSTMELTELDELVDTLDTEISRLDVAENKEAVSLLLCSFGCGGGYSWYWNC